MFVDGTIHLTIGLELGKYIYAICKNWNNYEPNDKVVAGNKKNDKETKNMEGPPDDLYILYGIYN